MKEKILIWTPRVLGIMIVLFMMMFSADCFDGDGTLSEKLICLVMHNIPAFIVALIITLAWFRNLAGGLILIFLTFSLAFFFRTFQGNTGSIIILAPLLVTGILFTVNGIRSLQSS
jgi:hypothetical protein